MSEKIIEQNKPENTIRYLNNRYILTSQLEKRASEYITYNGFDIICDLNKRIGNNEYLKNLNVSDVDPDSGEDVCKFYNEKFLNNKYTVEKIRKTNKFQLCKENEKEEEQNIFYRGDTIISFNTIAGYMIEYTKEFDELYDLNVYRSVSKDKQEKNLSMILGSNGIKTSIKISEDLKKELGEDVSKALKKKFCEFYYLYHTKANFMPLPKGLNTVKGNYNTYKDFPKDFF